jgi:Fe-S cluster assembly iron-binding protein IscA
MIGENTIILSKEMMEGIVQHYFETQMFKGAHVPIVQSIEIDFANTQAQQTFKIKTYGAKKQFVEQLRGAANDKPTTV